MSSAPRMAVIETAPAPKVANPAPLGLAGFGLTTVVLCSINAGLLKPEALGAVIPLAFAFGGLCQIITGVLEYKNGNTFGTVAFTAYGAFWWWWALLLWTVAAGLTKAPSPAGVGTVLLMWGVFTFYMWIPTFRSNKAIWLVFLLLATTFFTLAAGDFGWAHGKHIGGYIGLATGFAALYVSFAEVMNITFGKTVIPLGKPIIS